MTKIIEIDSMEAARIHGNLWNAPSNQIRRTIGKFTTVHSGDRCGTVRDVQGKYWDWWILDSGTIQILEAT